MRKFLFAFAALFGAFISTAHAEEFFTWGVEDYECGIQHHYVVIAGGAPIHIQRIEGVITGGPLPGAAITGSNIRNTLISVTHSGATIVPPAVVAGTNPTGTRWSHGVNGNYFAINVKQSGSNVVAIPFNRTFNSLAVSDGVLRMDIDNMTSDGTNTACGVVSSNEILDAEIQVTFYFTRD